MKIIWCIPVLGLLLMLTSCQSGIEQPTKSAALETITSPWADCDIGSFVHYKILMIAGNFIEERQTVLEIRRNQVILEVSLRGNTDEWEHKNMMAVPLKVMGKPEKTIEVTEEIVTIKGKPLRCKVERKFVYDAEHGNKKIVMQTWMSDDIPGGVVRITQDDKVIVEVVDFEKK
ncbi:MAG: hypothetical protein V1709_11065 [Planctomycetota bacterium]